MMQSYWQRFKTIMSNNLPNSSDMKKKSDEEKKLKDGKQDKQRNIYYKKCYKKCNRDIKKASKRGEYNTYANLSHDYILLLKKEGYGVVKSHDYNFTWRSLKCLVHWNTF